MAEKWIQAATEKMAEKGTLGKFGKATKSKVASAKKKGGVEKKRAVFAENMKKIAAKHKMEKKGVGASKKSHKSVGKMTTKKASKKYGK